MLNMFDMSDKDRLERIQKTVNTDYTNRHDSAMLNLFPTDLEWLVQQAGKAARYEKALKYLSEDENYMDRYYVLDHVVDIAERALEDKVLEELYELEE